MPILSLKDLDLKLYKERKRFDRVSLEGVQGRGQKWTLRCMHKPCTWRCLEHYQTHEAAQLVGEHHADMTGHPVKFVAVVEFDCGVIRSKNAVR